MARVWSSEGGSVCPNCDRAKADCICGQAAPPPTGDGIVRVGRETKGRKGKGVTVVTGIPLAGAELKALAKEMKTLCGSGGTVKAGVIEIQGEHRDRLVAALRERGWKTKRTG